MVNPLTPDLRYSPYIAQPTWQPTRQPAAEPRTVEVQAQRGESLESLGQRYGISSGRMEEANPDLPAASDPLEEGDTVQVPID